MKVIITGGAGFIGCNAAARFSRDGMKVVILDNLSRRGSQANLGWLRQYASVEFTHCDIRNYERVGEIFAREAADAVVHLAGQVAVTTSVTDPRSDFEANALGTFNVLEAARLNGEPFVLYASTNKVYGGMEEVGITAVDGVGRDESAGRYTYSDLPHGVPETQLLDFHSPYGCSKGAADQYVRDYARIYGMRTAVFRQSCIYGPRQFGIEDQGWVAWFTVSAVAGRPLNIYGNGKQVRDLLHVDDLTRAYEIAIERRNSMTGKIYNVGGGPSNTLSLLGLVRRLERFTGKQLSIQFCDWRPGDQPVYISDIRKAENELGWLPDIDSEEGVRQLLAWVNDNEKLIREQLGDLLR